MEKMVNLIFYCCIKITHSILTKKLILQHVLFKIKEALHSVMEHNSVNHTPTLCI